MFAEEELALAQVRTTTSTRLGLRTSPWQGSQVTAALGQQVGQDAQRLFTTVGALQTFQLSDAWSIDFAVDNSITLKGDQFTSEEVSPFGDKQPVANGLAGNPSGDDFTSISLGTTYAQDLWAATLKVETRQGSARDKWGVSAGAYREVADGIGVALQAEFFDQSGSAGPIGTMPTYSTTYASNTSGAGGFGSSTSSLYGVQSLGRLRFSAAYRPVGSRFILLDSTEFRRERLDGDVFASRSNRIVNNVNLNVKLDRKTQISFQYAAKYLLEDIDGENLHGLHRRRRRRAAPRPVGRLRHRRPRRPAPHLLDRHVRAALQHVARLRDHEEHVGQRRLQLRRLQGQRLLEVRLDQPGPVRLVPLQVRPADRQGAAGLERVSSGKIGIDAAPNSSTQSW